MRLLGTKTEKSHSLYLIIYQVFKSIFSIENETLRLFSSKKLFHVRKLLPLQGDRLASIITQGDALGYELLPFQGVWGLTSENAYPLDSIKEGADEPVADDTCDVTYKSNPGDVFHIPAEGNLLQTHYYHTSGTTDNQH